MISVVSPAEAFQCLCEAVSAQIRAGYSDHYIADAVGTSKEFVRRQRRFLAPRPPILPQQLKRGIFCMESTQEAQSVNLKKKSAARDKLQVWVERDPYAHLKLGLAAIAEQSDTSISTVKRYLGDLVAACNGVSADEVWDQRRARGFVRGGNRRGDQKNKVVAPQKTASRHATSNGSSSVSDERKVISGHFDKDLYQQLAHLAIDRDCSMQALLVEGLNLLFEKEGLPTF